MLLQIEIKSNCHGYGDNGCLDWSHLYWTCFVEYRRLSGIHSRLQPILSLKSIMWVDSFISTNYNNSIIILLIFIVNSGDRAAIDSFMIVSGILALIVNGIIAVKSNSIVSKWKFKKNNNFEKLVEFLNKKWTVVFFSDKKFKLIFLCGEIEQQLVQSKLKNRRLYIQISIME